MALPIVNVKTDHGAVGNNSTNDRTALNDAIVAANTAAGTGGEATEIMLYFPAGTYLVTGGTLTQAHGNYSIIMDTGAHIHYVAANYAAVMWKIGRTTVQGDGFGRLNFELSAEGGGANPYTSTENVAFEFINIRHFDIWLKCGTEFVTALRMTADASFDGNKHMYDVNVRLGYLHACRRNLVQQAVANGWINNIKYYNGDFSGAPGTGLSTRYINLIVATGGSQNKSVFYEPLCDSTNFTAVYVSGTASAALYGGHMEDPDLIIEHESGTSGPPAEPCTWVAPRLEGKQHLISDPDGVGSWAYDPFWGPTVTPRPKTITGNYTLTVGDLRRQSKIASTASSAVALTIPHFGGGDSEPPVGAVVYVQRKGSGALTFDPDSGVQLNVPGGRKTNPVTLRAQGSTAALYFEAVGATQIWSVVGDLADA